MKIISRLYNSIKMRMIWCAYRLFPIDKTKIVISNYYGRGLGDNAKYIAEELLQRNQDIKIIWLVKNEEERNSLPVGVESCLFGSPESVYHLMTSKVWIDNCRKFFIMLKRKDQLYIQTWHGGGAQKRVELDAINKLADNYRKMAIRDAKNTDLMISESKFMTDLYHRSFWYGGPVYECGYPRYDILLKPDEALVSKVYKYFNLDKNKELVLYAPTFRADYSFTAYNIDFERLRNNLQKRFGKEYVILVHLHPNVANVEGGIEYDDRTVINSTFYPDTQELIAVSSILIGDYSSINYDFSLRCLPVFRYASDLAEYRNDRDLYFPFDEYPYPYAQNNDELEALVLNFNEELYLNKLNEFFRTLGTIMNPNSSKQIADLIVDFLHSRSKREFFQKNREKFIYKGAVIR